MTENEILELHKKRKKERLDDDIKNIQDFINNLTDYSSLHKISYTITVERKNIANQAYYSILTNEVRKDS